MTGKHALLSPSAAHRWLHCTASPRLEENEPDKGSDYTREGTLAHAICSRKLNALQGGSDKEGDKEIAALWEQYHTDAMEEYTDNYTTIVWEKLTEARKKTKDAQLLIETQLDFGDFLPDAFGTADAVIIADGTMEVIDFKYGKGVKVSAEKNPQMMIYALGAYDKFDFEYRIEKVKMTIVQPRIDNLSEWETTVSDLLLWKYDTLIPLAEKAYRGEGEQVPGEWCMFCKVKSRCRALSQLCREKHEKAQEPDLLTPEEIASDILPSLAIIKSWLSEVEEYALSQALAGVHYTGWKLVEGRSVRKIKDAERVAANLRGAGYTYEDIYRLRPLTELEKTTGYKTFAELCGKYIEKPAGKPTLVPEEDKRPAWNAIESDFGDIQ